VRTLRQAINSARQTNQQQRRGVFVALRFVAYFFADPVLLVVNNMLFVLSVTISFHCEINNELAAAKATAAAATRK